MFDSNVYIICGTVLMLMLVAFVAILALMNHRIEVLETDLRKALNNIDNTTDDIDMRIFKCENMVENLSSYVIHQER